MRVLVLGGTRFIGPPVVRRLQTAGHTVACFHRGETDHPSLAGVERIRGDRHALHDHATALRAWGADVVVDMLPIGKADARAVSEVFRGGTDRLVALSSADVYRAFGRVNGIEDGAVEPGPLTEQAPLRTTRFPYRGRVDRLHDYDKILCETIATGEPLLPAVVLRLPMVYGPGDYQHRFRSWLQRMDDRRPAILLKESFAGWRCSRAFVDDVAAAVALAVDHPEANGIYNVAEADAPTNAEWIAELAAVTGWDGRVVCVPAAACPESIGGTSCDAQHIVMATARIRAELGYGETLSRREALAGTIAWERDNPPEAADPPDYEAEDALLATLTADR